MHSVKGGLLTFFFPVARFENRVVLIGSGHPVFPGHRGKLNRLMEICSSRRTHVGSHDISPPPSSILVSPRSAALLEIPGSARCSFPSFWTSARLFQRLSRSPPNPSPSAHTCEFHIEKIGRLSA